MWKPGRGFVSICSGSCRLSGTFAPKNERVRALGINLLVLLVLLAMLLWTGHSLARLIWSWLPQDSAAALATLSSQDPLRPSAEFTVDLETIQRAFTLANDNGSVSVNTNFSQASDTQLELTLKGAVLSSDPQRSVAIIASGDEQQVYRTGDQIRNTVTGVQLESVFQDHVILMNNGREERLRIDVTQAEENIQNSPQGSLASTDVAAVSNIAGGADQLSDATDNALYNIIRLQIFQQEGRIQGLQIRHGSRADLLAEVGLRVGDLITAVDNVAVTELNQLNGLVLRLQQQASVLLQIRRGDEVMVVNVERSRLGLNSE